MIDITPAGVKGHGWKCPARPKLEVEERVMMLAYRLVRLIENQSPTLADSLLDRVRSLTVTRLPERAFLGIAGACLKSIATWATGCWRKRIRYRGALRRDRSAPRAAAGSAQRGDQDHHPDQGKSVGVSEERGRAWTVPQKSWANWRCLQLLEKFFDRAIYYAAWDTSAKASRKLPTRRIARNVVGNGIQEETSNSR